MGQFILKNQGQTEKLAKLLAKEISKHKKRCLSRGNRGALIFGLVGNLGAGKTTFIQAFARGLGIKAKITSPTFVLMKNYKNLYHIDCYRLKSAQDVLDLDFKEIISIPKNIIMIEWAEKIKSILPKNTIWVRFKIISRTERLISVE